MTRVFQLAFVALALSARSTAAHDLWIEPSAFFTSPGQVVAVRLRVGQDLVGDPVPRDPAAIDQFVAVDQLAKRPIAGRDGGDPAGVLRVDSPGVIVIGYRSRPSTVVLPANKFNQYLGEEGLEAIAATRAVRNQTGAEGRELFSRAAKSLVRSGESNGSQGDRALGFRLELVARGDPFDAHQRAAFQLLFESRPLPGALVVAVNRNDPSAKLTMRTDSQGRVSFPLQRAGMWLIKAVHMMAAPAGSGADWESIWASLTFERTESRR